MKVILFLTSLGICLSLAFGKTCADADECDADRCCVARAASQLERRGLCLRLSRLNARCVPKSAIMELYGNKYMLFCPCQKGLSCEPKGLKPGDENNTAKYLRSLRCQKEKSSTTVTDSGASYSTTSVKVTSPRTPAESPTAPDPSLTTPAESPTAPDPSLTTPNASPTTPDASPTTPDASSTIQTTETEDLPPDVLTESEPEPER